jgi:hypothetical protein
MLSRPEAQNLLDHGGATCPAADFEVIWSTVGGHPLSLGLIDAAVRQGATWQEIGLDCRAVGELEHRGERLADRLPSAENKRGCPVSLRHCVDGLMILILSGWVALTRPKLHPIVTISAGTSATRAKLTVLDIFTVSSLRGCGRDLPL